MLEVLLMLSAGVFIGLGIGLLPGIHPNMIILAVPFIASLRIETASLVAFVVSLGVANTFAEFIPSILLSAPDSESGLATLPGQRMLAQGKGLVAIRLAASGGLVATALCAILIPALMLVVPAAYAASREVIWAVLAAFVALMVLTERSKTKMFWAFVCFSLSGIIGMLAFRLPIDRTIMLFPVFTGLFAFPHLLLQIRGGVQMPEQSKTPESLELKSVLQPAALGTLGGILSGLLPGVGSSEIASVLSIEKSDRKFIASMGAIAASNVMVSFLALWLINNPRSGIAVALDCLVAVDLRTFLLILFSAVLAAGITAPLAIGLSRMLLDKLQKINYVLLSQLIFVFLTAAVGFFAGFFGLLVSLACCGLGLFANIIEIKRGILMGVLILPTILFFLGV